MDVVAAYPRRGAPRQGRPRPREPVHPGWHRCDGRAELRPLAPAGARSISTGSPSCGAGTARTARSSSARGCPIPRRWSRSSRAFPGPRHGLTHGGLATDPQPRDDRRQPRYRLARGGRLPPLLVEDAIVEIASVRGRGRSRSRRFSWASSERALTRRARHRCSAHAERCAADIHEGRHAERDGDLRLLARPSGGHRAGRGSCGVRVGGTGTDARPGAARRGRLGARAGGRGGAADRRCSWHRGLPTPCARGARGPGARAGASHEDRSSRSTATRTRPTCGAARACSTSFASGSGSRARKTPVSRESVARAPSCSTGSSSCACLVLGAQADGHELVTVEGIAEDGGSTGCRRRSSRRARSSAASAPRVDRRHRRPPRPLTLTERRRDPRGALGERLPVHGVRTDLRCGSQGG